MLTVTKQQTKVGLQIDLGGEIEESVNFDHLVGALYSYHSHACVARLSL